jgi:ATP-dependent DNA helicase RecG
MSDTRQFDWDAIERRSVAELWTPDEIFDDATAELLKRFYEDERIERKAAGIHADSLATYICMWANTPPEGGILVIGMEDDGRIGGCTAKGEQLVESLGRIKRDLVPDAQFTTKRIQATTEDGTPDFLQLIRVRYRDDKVVTTNTGEAFIRWHSGRHPLTDQERHELEIERGQVSFELEPCGLKYPNDFNIPAIKEWAAQVRAARKAKHEAPLHQTLANHRLGRVKGSGFEPNIACALLFANDPRAVVPGCMLRFQRIEGSHAATGKDRNVVRDVTVPGTVPEIITEARRVIEGQVRIYSRLGTDAKFYTAPEYPMEAWHEAVVNACVHRSYSLRGMNIFVKMFDDRLVVESPGPFPPLVTPENIYKVHHRRNYWLMDAMQFMELVKCENEGVKRIRDSMLAMDLPAPEFQQKQVGGAIVRVTLRNNQHMRERWVDGDVSLVLGAEVAASLNDGEKRIVNYIVEHGQINTTQTQGLFVPRLRWHQADKRLKGMATRGVIRRVERFYRDCKTHYVLADQSPKRGK